MDLRTGELSISLIVGGFEYCQPDYNKGVTLITLAADSCRRGMGVRSVPFFTERRFRVKLCLLKSMVMTCFCACAVAQGLSSAPEAAVSVIRPDAIRARMRFPSDSLLQGRGTGTPGYQMAALYVAAQLEALGLHPAGVNGTWYQTVPLRKSVVDDGNSSVVLVTKSGEQTLVSLKGYVLYADLNRTDSSVEAPVAFVGFGVTAKERDYDDYAGTDVKGKIAVMIDGAPGKVSFDGASLLLRHRRKDNERGGAWCRGGPGPDAAGRSEALRMGLAGAAGPDGVHAMVAEGWQPAPRISRASWRPIAQSIRS